MTEVRKAAALAQKIMRVVFDDNECTTGETLVAIALAYAALGRSVELTIEQDEVIRNAANTLMVQVMPAKTPADISNLN